MCDLCVLFSFENRTFSNSQKEPHTPVCGLLRANLCEFCEFFFKRDKFFQPSSPWRAVSRRTARPWASSRTRRSLWPRASSGWRSCSSLSSADADEGFLGRCAETSRFGRGRPSRTPSARVGPPCSPAEGRWSLRSIATPRSLPHCWRPTASTFSQKTAASPSNPSQWRHHCSLDHLPLPRGASSGRKPCQSRHRPCSRSRRPCRGWKEGSSPSRRPPALALRGLAGSSKPGSLAPVCSPFPPRKRATAAGQHTSLVPSSMGTEPTKKTEKNSGFRYVDLRRDRATELCTARPTCKLRTRRDEILAIIQDRRLEDLILSVLHDRRLEESHPQCSSWPPPRGSHPQCSSWPLRILGVIIHDRCESHEELEDSFLKSPSNLSLISEATVDGGRTEIGISVLKFGVTKHLSCYCTNHKVTKVQNCKTSIESPFW